MSFKRNSNNDNDNNNNNNITVYKPTSFLKGLILFQHFLLLHFTQPDRPVAKIYNKTLLLGRYSFTGGL